ncbi:hypothetical protein VPH5P1C_0115 [Vibrio phage 5P1c]
MELMWLVYAVENLTYGGSFFGTISICLLLASIVGFLIKSYAQWYNDNHKPIETVHTEVITTSNSVRQMFTEGFTVTTSEIEGLSVGVKYTVRKHWEGIKTISLLSDLSKNDYDYVSLEGDAYAALMSHLKDEVTKEKTYSTFTEGKKIVIPNLHLKSLVSLTVITCLLNTLLPERNTAIYMVGAYMIQEVVTADKTQALGNAAYNASLVQLNKWANESSDLAEMLVGSGLREVEEVVKTEVTETVEKITK